jgi:hypothetical protein
MTHRHLALLHDFLLFTFYALLFSSCSPAAPVALPEPITVQYSAAAQPRLAGLYDCAGEAPVIAEQRAVQYFDPAADLAIRLGEAEHSTTPAFEIGVEEIVVAVHTQNPIENLGLTEVRGLFSGRIRNWSQLGGADMPVQVWSYAQGEDMQQLFEAAVMQGAAVTSLARLAASPGEMAQAIANDVNAVGILPRRWMAGNVQAVYVAASAPVLAITSAEPQGAMKDLLACLQE